MVHNIGYWNIPDTKWVLNLQKSKGPAPHLPGGALTRHLTGLATHRPNTTVPATAVGRLTARQGWILRRARHLSSAARQGRRPAFAARASGQERDWGIERERWGVGRGGASFSGRRAWQSRAWCRRARRVVACRCPTPFRPALPAGDKRGSCLWRAAVVAVCGRSRAAGAINSCEKRGRQGRITFEGRRERKGESEAGADLAGRNLDSTCSPHPACLRKILSNKSRACSEIKQTQRWWPIPSSLVTVYTNSLWIVHLTWIAIADTIRGCSAERFTSLKQLQPQKRHRNREWQKNTVAHKLKRGCKLNSSSRFSYT